MANNFGLRPESFSLKNKAPVTSFIPNGKSIGTLISPGVGTVIGSGIDLLGSGIGAVGAGFAAAKQREEDRIIRAQQQENFERQQEEEEEERQRFQNLQGLQFLSSQRSGALQAARGQLFKSTLAKIAGGK